MELTSKGQVTIPVSIREKLGIGPHSEIEFVEERGKFYIVSKDSKGPFEKLRGRVRGGLSTDEILKLTRN
jgi:AbrB family looped-hinge helix DNA binding protein